MKRILLVCFLYLGLCHQTIGQSDFSIGLKAGTLLSGKVQFYEGVFNPGPSPSFGINFTQDLGRYQSIELEYSWALRSKTNFYYFDTSKQDFSSNLSTHYLNVNAISKFTNDSKVTPFSIYGLGLAFYDLNNRTDKTFFSLNLGLGTFVELNDRFDLRFQGRMIMPMAFQGAGIFVGIGSGGVSPGLSANATIPMLQGDFTAGLSYKF